MTHGAPGSIQAQGQPKKLVFHPGEYTDAYWVWIGPEVLWLLAALLAAGALLWWRRRRRRSA